MKVLIVLTSHSDLGDTGQNPGSSEETAKVLLETINEVK